MLYVGRLHNGKFELFLGTNRKKGGGSSSMLYRGLVLALAATHAWNDCAFPDVGYFTVDEGIGMSFALGAAGMNGNLCVARTL